jgi:hypothetical protein
VAILVAAGLVLASVAAGVNRSDVSRAVVSPGGAGNLRRPLPIAVQFDLRSRAENSKLRPLPTRTYILGIEGVRIFAKSFPACSLTKLKRHQGPPASCTDAKLGSGLVKGAAGLEEDETIAESVACNLKLILYNTGNSLALRLDANPPLPTGFKSNKIGCPVPIHTAVPAPSRSVTIDGVPSTELRFTVPDLLMHPLEGWNSALQLISLKLEKRNARIRIGAATRTVGYVSAIGCAGGRRSFQVHFIGTDGVHSGASTTTVC